MLMAVMWLLFNGNVNRHVHVLSDGYAISHAHPFKGNPADQDSPDTHRHSRSELMLLSLFTNITTTLLVIFCIKPLVEAIPQVITITYPSPEPLREYYQVHHYHAPPAG